MVMNLPPFSIDESEDPRRPDRHFQCRFTGIVLTPFSTHDIEDLPRFMIAIVMELKPILPGTAEDPLIQF